MPPVKLTVSQAPARRVCVGCDMLMEPVKVGAPICKHCAPDPDGARARIATRLRAAENILAAAARRLSECLAALSPDERERWHKLDHARRLVAEGQADDATHRRVHITVDALKSNDARMGPALCAVYAAEEAWFWAGQEHMHHAKRAAEQTAVLDAWLAATEKEPAHAAD